MLMVVGGTIFVLGLVLSLFARAGLGRLPGDIVVQRGNWTLHVPIVTSILLSLVLTGILWLLRR